MEFIELKDVYKVYKNGDIIGKHGKKIAVRVKNGMKVVSLKN